MSIRIGMVGAGGIARRHADVLKELEDVEVIAVCDIDKNRAQELASRFGASTYVDHKTMYESEKLDCVYVSVPPFAHLDIEVEAARRGIHIFVEKPVHLVLEKSLMIRDEIEKSGVINSVGYCLRYASSYCRTKELLEGRVPTMLLACEIGGMPETPWWRVKEQSGGQHTEQATHLFDLARYLLGEVRSVYARAFKGIMEKKVENYNIEDASAVTLEFESGAIGVVLSTCIIPQGHLREHGVMIYCDETVIEAPGDRVRVIERGRTTEESFPSQPHREESVVFLEAVKSSNQSLIRSSYRDAVETLRLTLSADGSMQTGKAVQIVRD